MSLLLSTGAFASSLSAAAAPGMVLMKPTSIAHSGTSATLGANGQVTFTAVTSLSLNGCFTADFDNYVMTLAGVLGGGQNMLAQLRVSGSDATGANYVRQALIADGSSVTASRATGQTSFFIGVGNNTLYGGNQIFVYGPALTQPTATRSVNAHGSGGARILDDACTHSLSTSYDGMTITRQTGGSFTGTIAVYGIRS